MSLRRAVEALVRADARTAPAETLRGLGLSTEESAALFARPDALRELLTASVEALVLPALPAIIRRLVQRASAGTDPDAEKLVLSLLGEKSPLREHTGLGDLRSASDAGLAMVARQLSQQLAALGRGDKDGS